MSDTLQNDDVIVTSSTFGSVEPVYTWRKGGTDDDADDHFYLIVGSATDPVVKATNTLIEIDPDTKLVKFWGKTELLDTLKLQENSIDGSVITDGTLKASKLEPDITINGSVKKLTTARTIDGVSFDGTSDITHYMTCSTASATAAKIVINNDFKLVTGASVYVKFNNANTAANPTLNVSETGAKAIRYDNAAFKDLKTNRVYHFIYDGTYFQIAGDINSDTNDKVKQTLDDSSTSDYNVLFTNDANKTNSNNSYSRHSTHLKFTPATSTLKAKIFSSDLNTQTWVAGSKGNAILSSETTAGNYVAFLKYPSTNGVLTLSGYKNALLAVYQTNDLVDNNTNQVTYKATLLDESGNAEFPGTVSAETFKGNATSATKAVTDRYDNTIDETYLTIADASNTYLKLSGGTTTGVIKLKAVGTESNTQASTVGYVDESIATAKTELKDEILNGAGEGYESLKELSELIKNNKDAIETISKAATGSVKYNEVQSLTSDEKNQARVNIDAFPATGGTISGNVTVSKVLTVGTFNTNNALTIKDTNANVKSAPISDINTGVYVSESNNKNVGQFNVKVDTNNTSTASIKASQMTTSTQKSAELGISVTSSGTVNTFAPTPVDDSNDTNIATTAWVRTLLGSQSDVISEKTYTGVLSNTNNDTVYYATITPTNQDVSWHIRLKFDIKTQYSDYQCCGYIDLVGIGNKCGYQYWLTDKTSKAAISGFDVAMTYTGPHYIGFNFSKADNPNTTGYERTINIVLYDQTNCSVNYITPTTSATYVTLSSVTALTSGFYVESANSISGDKLSTWNRVATVGSTPLFQNTLVAENANGTLVSLITDKTNKTINTTAIDPMSVLVYTGTDLAASNSSITDGQLFIVNEFDASTTFNDISAFNANQKLYLKGKINYSTGLMTLATSGTLVSSLPSTNDGYQYVHIGYSSDVSTTRGYLTAVRTVYAWKDGKYNRIVINPVVNEPVTSSNDTSVATTKWVRDTIASSLTDELTLINPIIHTTDDESKTSITIKAASGSVIKGTDPVSEVIESIIFSDGSESIESDESALAIMEYDHDSEYSALTLTALDPSDTTANDSDTCISVGYKKSGTSWVPFTQAMTPATDSNDDSIATTAWVKKQVPDVIDGGEL